MAAEEELYTWSSVYCLLVPFMSSRGSLRLAALYTQRQSELHRQRDSDVECIRPRQAYNMTCKLGARARAHRRGPDQHRRLPVTGFRKPMLLISSEANGYKAEGFSRHPHSVGPASRSSRRLPSPCAASSSAESFYINESQ